MKKIILSLTVLLTSLALITSVNASSFKANIIGDDTFNEEITLNLQVNDLVDFSGVCNGLCGLVGSLKYDSEKIELTSISALQDFDLTQGSTIVLYNTTGVPSGTSILSMKFKNKSLAKDETTTITFSDIVASDGDKDITTSNASKTIKLVEKKSTTVDTSNKQTTTTKKKKTKKSTNNYLSSITLDNGSIEFDKDKLTYDVLLSNEIETITITAVTEDKKASIEGDGTYNLLVGANNIKITVTAEDGSKRVYTISVNREEAGIEGSDVSNDVENDIIEKENNYLIPMVITSAVLLGAIIFFVVYKGKKNK